MLIMTAKIDKTKFALALGAIAVTIGLLFALLGGSGSDAILADTNDARVKILTDLGWDVTLSPAQSMEVRIPQESSQVFDRYNDLQKSQGYDLSKLAGKTVTRYLYTITNYPGATEPVYASLLVYQNRLVGGDITDTTPGGQILGLVPRTVSEP